MSGLLKILFADDCELAREFIKSFLNQIEVDMHWAIDGEDALRKFYSENYDLVILDNQMPGILGVDVGKIIRKSNQTVPIILYSTDTDLTRDQLVPFTEVWPKPISKNYLISKIKKYQLRKINSGNVINF